MNRTTEHFLGRDEVVKMFMKNCKVGRLRTIFSFCSLCSKSNIHWSFFRKRKRKVNSVRIFLFKSQKLIVTHNGVVHREKVYPLQTTCKPIGVFLSEIKKKKKNFLIEKYLLFVRRKSLIFKEFKELPIKRKGFRLFSLLFPFFKHTHCLFSLSFS